MGVRVFVILLVTLSLAITMSTPLSYSDEDENYDENHRYMNYEEKRQKELDRLLAEYLAKEPKEGGAPDVEMVDFEQIHKDELKQYQNELDDHSKIIKNQINVVEIQNEVIHKENQKFVQAQQRVQDEWGAPKPDNTQLVLEYEILEDMNDKLKELIDKQNKIEQKINTKELLLEVLEHDAKIIGIELSATCIAAAKLNMTTCPTYEDLLPLDESFTEISGKFSYHDGYFHREPSNYNDSYRAYETDDKIRIVLDPPFNEKSRIKMITIEPNFGYYSEPSISNHVIDGKRVLGKERIINDCYTARISVDNWKKLLPDTILTFRNGCQSAEISNTESFEMPKTEIDVWSSPNIAYSQWLLEMREKCKELC